MHLGIDYAALASRLIEYDYLLHRKYVHSRSFAFSTSVVYCVKTIAVQPACLNNMTESRGGSSRLCSDYLYYSLAEIKL